MAPAGPGPSKSTPPSGAAAAQLQRRRGRRLCVFLRDGDRVRDGVAAIRHLRTLRGATWACPERPKWDTSGMENYGLGPYWCPPAKN